MDNSRNILVSLSARFYGKRADRSLKIHFVRQAKVFLRDSFVMFSVGDLNLPFATVAWPRGPADTHRTAPGQAADKSEIRGRVVKSYRVY